MKQHIASFDYFVQTEIKKVVAAAPNHTVRSEVDPNFYLTYTDVYVGSPSIEEDAFTSTAATPFECRLRDCTYSAPIYVDVRYRRGPQIVTTTRVPIGRIPIMLRSAKCVLHGKTWSQLGALKECPHDPGGYFIVKGVERVILMQEQLSKNRMIIELDTRGFVCATITSSTHERKSRCSIIVKPTSHGHRVYLKHNTLGDEIPVVVILKAMGMEADQEIAELVGSADRQIANIFINSMEEPCAARVKTQMQALAFVGEAIRAKQNAVDGTRGMTFPPHGRRSLPAEDEAREVLAHVVLSHVPVKKYDFVAKRTYIGHVTRRLLAASLDHSMLDDKDYYGNKRLELAGQLLSLLFEDLFKRFNSDLKRSADLVLQKPNRTAVFDIVKSTVWRTDTITQGFSHAISTGNWVLKRFKMDRAGVTQVLSRLSYVSAIGMMTRVNSQFEKTRKTSGPRALQASQWGMLCPADTPEGETCGLVKNLALLAHVTTDAEVVTMKCLCFDLGVEQLGHLNGSELNSPTVAYLVFLNGLAIGACWQPYKLASALRHMRRSKQIGEFVSVYTHAVQRAIYIACDGGRVCRPLIIATSAWSRRPPVQLAASLLGNDNGIIEYIDVNEENNCFIALNDHQLTPRHTHTEIDPVTILGVVSGLVAFPHHNQSPRNTYQCAMGKQAMGSIATNQYERMDSLLYSLVYPERPIVKSRVLDLIYFDSLPGGCNGTLAVMSYSGYDIEDAIVLNKASLDRGFMRCLVIKKHQASIRRYANGACDRAVGPPPISSFVQGANDTRYKRYRALDDDGICRVGEKLSDQCIMINREMPVEDKSQISFKEQNTCTTRSRTLPASMPPRSYKPQPCTYKAPESSVVDRVLLSANETDQFLVKVMVRQCRRPEVGDKFASRHGQKGVCGAIVSQVILFTILSWIICVLTIIRIPQQAIRSSTVSGGHACFRFWSLS
jgi:DNA-directed RNA polymerase III subunit RPC2